MGVADGDLSSGKCRRMDGCDEQKPRERGEMTASPVGGTDIERRATSSRLSHSRALYRGVGQRQQIEMAGQAKWEETAAAKRRQLLELLHPYQLPDDSLPPASQLNVTTFPAQSGLFSDLELKIIAAEAPEILDQIASQTWTAEQVAVAYCKAAAAAHQLVCLLSAIEANSLVSNMHA